MPEEQEVETEKLHEAIHEELEREGGRFLRWIAFSTAVFAAFAAIASLYAGSTVNEALVLKTESARLQGEASDAWAHYQSKGIKAAAVESARAAWLAAGKQPPAELAQQGEKYRGDQVGIEQQAREKEKLRDEKSKEADELLHRHHGFANGVALFQVAIALGAVAALTRNRLVWYASMLLGVTASAVVLLRLFVA